MDLTQLRDRVFREVGHARPLTVEDVDDALNLVQRSMLQGLARVEDTADYTTTAATEVALTSVAADVYELRSVEDMTDSSDNAGVGRPVPLLDLDDFQHRGVRLFADTLYFQWIGEGRTLRFHYYRKLQDLGTVTTPEIDDRWHDLYWLGAAAFLNPGNRMLTQMFDSRLDEYRKERWRAGRANRRKARVVRDWE